MAILDGVFSAIGDFSRAMSDLHGSFLGLVRKDIERYREMTGNLQGQYNWQAWTVIGLSGIGASLAVVGTMIPKGGDAASTALNDPRLGANAGITDAVSNAMKAIEGYLKDDKFLRQTCKSASQFFHGITPAAGVWYQGKTTALEADRQLIQMCFQDENQNKSAFAQDGKRAQDAALNILQSKSKGG